MRISIAPLHNYIIFLHISKQQLVFNKDSNPVKHTNWKIDSIDMSIKISIEAAQVRILLEQKKLKQNTDIGLVLT